MSIHLTNIEESTKWNDIINEELISKFFDKFEWCQALGLASDKIEPVPLFVEDGKTTGVFPTCLVKYSYSTVLDSLPFSDYGGGPILRRDDALNNSNYHNIFYKNLLEYALEKKCIKISLRRTYFPDLINENLLNKLVVTDVDSCTFIISLKQDIDQIYKKIRGSRRTSIRKGEKKGTIVREAHNIDDLKNFYETYVDTMSRLKNTPLPYRFFDFVWNAFVIKDEAQIFIAEYENKVIGGILLLLHKDICHAWSCGSLYEYTDKRPLDLLIWDSIKWAHDQEYNIFDLGGTINDPSSGLYFYKKTWGGEKKDLYNHHIILQPKRWKFYSLCNALVKKIKKII
jgi:lipid II:glycine glycyltransferase (peptidoglycan interpeptide bridge formation enzyme)